MFILNSNQQKIKGKVRLRNSNYYDLHQSVLHVLINILKEISIIYKFSKIIYNSKVEE